MTMNCNDDYQYKDEKKDQVPQSSIASHLMVLVSVVRPSATSEAAGTYYVQ